MNPVTIDVSKCITCALCIKDCPNNFLYLKNDEILTHEKGCMECGHCYSICSQNAISMTNFNCRDEKVMLMF